MSLTEAAVHPTEEADVAVEPEPTDEAVLNGTEGSEMPQPVSSTDDRSPGPTSAAISIAELCTDPENRIPQIVEHLSDFPCPKAVAAVLKKLELTTEEMAEVLLGLVRIRGGSLVPKQVITLLSPFNLGAEVVGVLRKLQLTTEEMTGVLLGHANDRNADKVVRVLLGVGANDKVVTEVTRRWTGDGDLAAVGMLGRSWVVQGGSVEKLGEVLSKLELPVEQLAQTIALLDLNVGQMQQLIHHQSLPLEVVVSCLPNVTVADVTRVLVEHPILCEDGEKLKGILNKLKYDQQQLITLCQGLRGSPVLRQVIRSVALPVQNGTSSLAQLDTERLAELVRALGLSQDKLDDLLKHLKAAGVPRLGYVVWFCNFSEEDESSE